VCVCAIEDSKFPHIEEVHTMTSYAEKLSSFFFKSL